VTTDEPGSEIANPEVIEALERIAKDDPDGLIEPSVVVQVARDPDSPLHHYIWLETDEEAAHERRLALARRLIARVRITIIEQGPALVNVRIRAGTDGERRGYVPTQRAVMDPDLRAQVMAEARRGIAAYRARLSAFEAARRVVGHLDAALEEME